MPSCLSAGTLLRRVAPYVSNKLCPYQKPKSSLLINFNYFASEVTLIRFLFSLGVDRLFRACSKRLESLSFVGCSKGAFQADYFLMVSSRQCPNLHYIDASYNQSVRDQTVRAISSGSRALKSLLLNGAQLISNSAIEHVVRRHKTTLVSQKASKLKGLFDFFFNVKNELFVPHAH